MHRNALPIFPDGITYNTDLFVSEATRVIRRQNSRRQPFFLLLSLPLMHMPVIVDEDILNAFEMELEHIKNPWRKKTAVMAIVLDNAVKTVLTALQQVMLYQSSF